MEIEKIFRIIDSYQVLKSSLKKLVLQYIESGERINIIDKTLFKIYGIEKTDEIYNLLIKQKGSFPFDYCDDNEKFNQKEFPEKIHFFNKLKESDISDIDYRNAYRIYELSSCQNLGDYLQLYCMTDTIFLSEIYICLRNIMYEKYGLDVAQYLNLPSFSLDAFLYSKYL